jgi:flagellar protein FlbD
MIHLTRINRVPLVLNSDLIEHVEATPDTVISLTTGQKILVLESPSEIMDRVIQFRRSIGGAFRPSRGAHADLHRVAEQSADSSFECCD